MNKLEQKTILLVEDEAIIGLNESIQLQDYGYDVIHVLNGQNAIESVNNHRNKIHLVLMDIDLGQEVDGTEIAKTILTKHDLPILFLSSHSEREIVKKTEDITSYGYVVKNSSITVLDASIKMAFRLHDAYSNLKKQKLEIESKQKGLEYFEKRYRRLFESAKDGILILDADSGMIVDVNPFLMEMLGYSKEEFLKKSIWDINAFKYIDYSKQLFKELQDKEYVRYLDLPLEARDGSLVHVEFVSNVYLVDNEKVIQCNIRDTTERNRYEKSLTKNLDEKDSMLKELQHRTKNSFSMINSLINLRSIASSSGETKKTLEELNLRVKSISDLYSLLYETDSFSEVQLQVYCNKVIESIDCFSGRVTVDQDIDAIVVTTKVAATIGMVLVELMSNCIKYAFPDDRKGIIRISLKKLESRLALTVEDNGVGLPKQFDIMNAKTLGLHLVRLMVSQLNGSIKFIVENGTKVLIECQL